MNQLKVIGDCYVFGVSQITLAMPYSWWEELYYAARIELLDEDELVEDARMAFKALIQAFETEFHDGDWICDDCLKGQVITEGEKKNSTKEDEDEF